MSLSGHLSLLILYSMMISLPALGQSNSSSGPGADLVLKYKQTKFWSFTPSPFPDTKARLIWQAKLKEAHDCSMKLKSIELPLEERKQLRSLLTDAGFDLDAPHRKKLPDGTVQVSGASGIVFMCCSTDLQPDAHKYEIVVTVNESDQSATFDDGCGTERLTALVNFCKQKFKGCVRESQLHNRRSIKPSASKAK